MLAAWPLETFALMGGMCSDEGQVSRGQQLTFWSEESQDFGLNSDPTMTLLGDIEPIILLSEP